MRSMLTSRSSNWLRNGASWCGCAALAMMAYAHASGVAGRALAQVPGVQPLILVLFGDSLQTDGMDVNHDGAVTVADVVPGVIFVGTIAEFIPHNLNDQLIYRITDPSGAITTETTTVTSVGADGAFILNDHQADGQQVVLNEAQSYVDTGIQLLFRSFADDGDPAHGIPATTTTCDPPLIRLALPLIAGQTISTTTHCQTTRTVQGDVIAFADRTDTFTPIEITDSITVAAGTYTQVVHLSGTTDQGYGLESDEFYFKPGLGAILQLQTVGGYTTRHELVSGTIGGVPVGQ